MDFLNRVAQVAEQNVHHPDIELWAYQNVKLSLWTHTVRGLSEGDFVLAAKIDSLPISLSSSHKTGVAHTERAAPLKHPQPAQQNAEAFSAM